MINVVVVLLVVGGAMGAWILAPTAFEPETSQPRASQDSQAEPMVSPMLFADLTIPYLKEYRTNGTMGELSVFERRATYTSYLTSYKSDGLTINGLLTEPLEPMPPGGWPAVVFIHGYIPPTQYQTTEKYTDYVDYLARQGLVVFKIDLRGHGQSEGEASGAYFSGDYVIDALNAYQALSQLEFVNPEKIGLWGHSMAGNIVARTLAARPEIGKGVIWSGAVYTYQDMQDYGISDGSYRPPTTTSPRSSRRQLLFDTYGRYSAESDFWQQVTPIPYLREEKVSIQIHHAVDDPVVSIRYSRNLVEQLTNSDATLTLYEYQSGGHNISGTSFGTAMKRSADFLTSD
jgi:uncharacterized protein